MHRFFVDKENIKENKVFIVGEDVKHITKVLRLGVDDTVVLCDKEKNDFTAKISRIEKDYIECEVLKKTKSNSEPPVEIVLYQGLPKSAKMDLIIQKCVELGVTKIVPVLTTRTVVKIKNTNKEQKKISRWQKISEQAAKQSRRGIIPEIGNVMTFEEMISNIKNDEFSLVPYEDENRIGLKDILKKYNGKRVNIVIGPEGGFDESEVNKLKKIGAHIVSLGPRILRTETAGFTTIAVIMYELGDLGVI
ncbi:16S rRNA (uracil(1498)-N(3))-methyltransferase [Caldisalinibacter kiritimatiensis]|uniref:Ribosomal RNA small subunit methyltransferase E n=1 Tax=Caldisalinibacter kiritimatiensis TaxID=1304284 RepID=R1CVY6_9FIRM|nr:16S rRNA (uracil(1498)-N(3))-methyltransferase [Caldisalinibacter kiritimatiensis]EOD00804.1 Ribosomal RNA small subunit methyltransferase E [Caldisalinibacter kiritimatiensis]